MILDFGDHRVGTFKIHIDQTGSPMDAPLYMRIKFAELPAELAAESKDYEGWLSRSWIQEEFIHIDELPATLEQLPLCGIEGSGYISEVAGSILGSDGCDRDICRLQWLRTDAIRRSGTAEDL